MGVDNGECTFTLAARAQAAGVARARARAWLDAVDWPEPSSEDVVYALNEAVTNAIEHAYALTQPIGTVELRLHVEHDLYGSRRVRAQVSDHGRWRAHPADDEGRRRGLPLMRALMDEVTVHQLGPQGLDGTSVTLLSPPVPARRHVRPATR